MICQTSPHRSLLAVKAAGLWPDRVLRQFSECNSAAVEPEPTLDQLLDEPITKDLMRSDGVTRTEVVNLFALLTAAQRTH